MADKPLALITGASSGIGAAYARRLARDGYDLILIARRAEKMRELADELKQEHGAESEIVQADLADASGLASVEERIGSLNRLDMLINNAGFGAGGHYAEIDMSKQQAMIDLHVTAIARLCRAAAPLMEKQGAGAIINVSSVAGFAGMGRSAMYCSTKAWKTMFSRCLDKDMAPHGVRVQALCPGYTYTEFHDTSEFEDFSRSQVPKTLWLTADYVVDESLKDLKRGKTVSIPSWKYKLLVGVMKSPLGALLMWLAAKRRKH